MTLSPEALLREVASWPMEARDDNNVRYFYEIDEIYPLLEGKKNFVIGRKGTGKTAIGEHIASLADAETFAVKMSFKNFPWNKLYELNDATFNSPNQYISAWKIAMLSALLKLFSKLDACDPSVRELCNTVFPNEIDRELRSGFKKLIDRGLNFSIAGTGGGIEQRAQASGGNIADFVDGLETFIAKNLVNGTFYIIFDELDEDYRDILTQPDHKDRFFQLLTSLFKATQDIRYLSNENGFRVVPIILLRSDIYDLLRDPDKNKWRDRTVDLNWSPAMLKRLLAYRISKAIDETGDTFPFDDAWKQLFSVELTTFGRNNKKKLSTYDYIISSTYLRPRDLISYVRECARIALENNVDRISNSEVKAANERHSLYSRRELVDEMHSVMEDADRILDIFTEAHKTQLSYVELRSRVLNYMSSHRRADGLSATQIVDLLFYFGVIGNIDQNGNTRFSYDGSHVLLRRDALVCIHRSLLKGLQIF